MQKNPTIDSFKKICYNKINITFFYEEEVYKCFLMIAVTLLQKSGKR